MKHCLILNCTENKLHDEAPAFEMYSGSVLGMLKSKKVDQQKLFETFEVFFISAKYGLIHSSEVITKYDTKMSSKLEEQQAFAKKHKRQANKLLKQYAVKGAELFMVVSKDYESAFELMNLSAVKKFASFYTAKGAAGVGVYRGKLGKILKAKMAKPVDPKVYRSGCTQSNEFLGYRGANEPIGTSLAYCSGNKQSLQYFQDAVRSGHPVFLDNGIITSVSKGQDINPDEIMTQYVQLVDTFKTAKSLDVVIPDAPFDQNQALAIIQQYKTQIQFLATKCNVIIVFHKPVQRSVKEQLMLVSAILGKDTPFVVGIPCRTNINGENWRLPVSDIESLFSVKNSKGVQAIRRAHFLGISEAAKGQAFQERVTLCQMYGVAFQCDSNRTTAIFGNQKTSNRLGTLVANDVVIPSLMRRNAANSSDYIEYEPENEHDEPQIWEALRSKSWEERWQIWNKVLPWELEPLDSFTDEEELEQYYFENTCDAEKYQGVWEQLKKELLDDVFVYSVHEPSFNEVRQETITRCFLGRDEKRQSIQMAMGY